MLGYGAGYTGSKTAVHTTAIIGTFYFRLIMVFL